MSSRRMAAIFGPDGKLHAAPELIIEVPSPGAANEKRDREAKLKLYSRRGVDEYWIVDWRQRRIEVFRREQAQLALAATLMESDILTTPLLPACKHFGTLTAASCPQRRLRNGAVIGLQFVIFHNLCISATLDECDGRSLGTTTCGAASDRAVCSSN